MDHDHSVLKGLTVTPRVTKTLIKVINK
jgi:hypothetical protein